MNYKVSTCKKKKAVSDYFTQNPRNKLFQHLRFHTAAGTQCEMMFFV